MTPAHVPHLPDDVEQLPRVGVSDYVARYARACQVVAERGPREVWAQAITRHAGDEVQLDATGQLLVALKKRHLISGRQLARLLTNHLREQQGVRSVPGLPDSGLPA